MINSLTLINTMTFVSANTWQSRDNAKSLTPDFYSCLPGKEEKKLIQALLSHHGWREKDITGNGTGYFIPYKKDQIVFTKSLIRTDVIIELIWTLRTHAPLAWLSPKPNRKKEGEGRRSNQKFQWFRRERRVDGGAGKGIAGDMGTNIARREKRVDGGTGEELQETQAQMSEDGREEWTAEQAGELK
uniref:Uncharacterized protein n=1 Tax=Nelumbo nucifera TaxID=4432 RepID=A0A822Z0L1_NELNU|nr:TPA_asm: hypothetical protein HUJ06_007670 [Nelumbo nucifera]